MIDATLRAFLEQGLSLHVATRDRDMRPVGARALALRVDEDRVHLTVYVAEVAMERLLVSLDASRQVAVDIGRPEDDRACQVKGIVEAVRPARDDERALVVRQWEGLRDQLGSIGVARASTAQWATWPAVAVEMQVTAVFEQTPGPLAGTMLT
jgi:hypothetical protein